MIPTLQSHDALLIVDMQRDFLPGGRLAVRGGDEVIPVLNRYIDLALGSGVPIYASRDWHPANHCSFRAQGGPWPEHCVAGAPGSAFAPDLRLPPDTYVIDKATRADEDAYSAFGGTRLAERLRDAGVKRLLVGGLATDYCVLNTTRDALAAGFEVLLLTDAIRAVNVQPDDGARAQEEMERAGATPVRRDDFAS